MQVIDFAPSNESLIQQAAALLMEGFRENWPNAWPNLASALREVRGSFGLGRINRIAVDDDGTLLGWVGGSRQYDGHVWELHPLVVKPGRQGRGIGRTLVSDFEGQVRQRGGLTIWVGSDDESNMTTVSGVDLWPDVLGSLGKIANLRGHPYEFYQKMGFVLIGVLPDANGPGKPDVYLAKSVRRPMR